MIKIKSNKKLYYKINTHLTKKYFIFWIKELKESVFGIYDDTLSFYYRSEILV